MRLSAKQYAHVVVNVLSHAPDALRERFAQAFWKLLVENRQQRLLPAIFRHADRMWKEKHGIVAVTATTASALSSHDETSIGDTISRLFGRSVSLSNVVDSSLGGGLILQIEDTRYDGSIRGRLRQLAASLHS